MPVWSWRRDCTVSTSPLGSSRYSVSGEIAPDVAQQPRLVGQPGDGHQRAVGDLGRVVRAAFAVLALGVLVDAFAQPVVDPGHQQPARPQVVEWASALQISQRWFGVCTPPSASDRADRRMIAAYFSRAAAVAGWSSCAQQVVAEAQVADDERGVRRAVQVADVVETARVLPVGQRVQQGVQRAEQGRAVMVLRRAG